MAAKTRNSYQSKEKVAIIRQHLRLACPANVSGWLLLVAIVAAHLPLTFVYAGQLWSTSHYQFFPLVLVGATCIAWRAIRYVDTAPAIRLSVACCGFAVAQLILLFAVIWHSPWVAWIALLIVVLPYVYTCAGWQGVVAIFPGWLLLWIIVRLPLNLDGALIMRLQSLTASACGRVLDTLGVLHRMSGHVIELPGQKLLVAEACSGIHSLFSLLACTAFLVIWCRASLLRSMLLFAAAVFWVGIANLSRVVSVTILAAYDSPIPNGWPHEMFGLLIFLITVFLVWSTDQLFLSLFAENPPDHSNPVGESAPPSPLQGTRFFALRPASRRGLRGAYAAILLVYLLLTSVQLFAGLGPVRPSQRELPFLAGLASGDLPSQWKNWTLRDFTVEERLADSIWKQHSRIWHYDFAGMSAAVALDYPFAARHDVTKCYESQGWEVTRRDPHRATDGFERNVIEFNAQPPGVGQLGSYVMFAMFDDHLRPPPTSQRISDRIWDRLDKSRKLMVQVRLMIESYSPPSDVQKAEAREFLRVVSQHISEELGQRIAEEEGQT